MRKLFRTVALPLGAALLSPCAAFGQSQSPVTLYGRAFVMAESVRASGGSAPAVEQRLRVTDRLSLIGVRGTEPIGPGLEVLYQLETAFLMESASTPFATRNSGVGIKGGWGTLLAGRWDTPFKVVHASPVDVFADLGLADITGAAMNQGNFSRRESNSIHYWSPSWKGLSARAFYSANEGRTAALNPYSFGASVALRSGSLYVAYAHETHADQVQSTPTAGVNERGQALSATYSIGAAKLSGQYGEYRSQRTLPQRGLYLGAEWKKGKHVLLASYQSSRGGGASSAVAQPECDIVGIGYRYDFTRRTSLVAEHASVKNREGNLCNFGTNPLPIASGQDPTGAAIGLRHTF